MSRTATSAKMRPDGTVVEVAADDTGREFAETPMRPMTQEAVDKAAWADPAARPTRRRKSLPGRAASRAPRPSVARGLTQEEFAARYRIPLGTLRDWERGRSEPDQPARAYLTVIAHNPEGVRRALEYAPNCPGEKSP